MLLLILKIQNRMTLIIIEASWTHQAAAVTHQPKFKMSAIVGWKRRNKED